MALFAVVGIGIWSIWKTAHHNTPSETSGDENSQQETFDKYRRVSLEELRTIVIDHRDHPETIIIDARPASLWSEGHIIGSKNLAYEEMRQSFDPTDEQKSAEWIILATDPVSAGRFAELFETRGIPPDRIRLFDETYDSWQRKTGLVVRKADPSSLLDITKVTLTSPQEAKAAIDSGGQWFLLDIRSPDSFSKERIAGSTNIPLSELEEKRAMIPLTARTLVYGKDDRESFSGGVLLFDLGFFNAITLSAGFDAWKDAGLPIEE